MFKLTLTHYSNHSTLTENPLHPTPHTVRSGAKPLLGGRSLRYPKTFSSREKIIVTPHPAHLGPRTPFLPRRKINVPVAALVEENQDARVDLTTLTPITI